MKDILNLYKYKVYVDRVDGINVKIIFSIGMLDKLHDVSSMNMDIMNLCLALNKEFGILKIDAEMDEYDDDIEMYIIVDKDLGYKILKTFLDNTDNLEEIKRIDNEYAKTFERFYGDTYFSDYIEEYKNKLSNYENVVNKQVTLDVFNLYTKKAEWYLDEKERICITIAENECKALHIANSAFNVLDICKALEFRFGVYMVGLIYDSCAKLAFSVENASIGYKLLKSFLNNTDESLLEDKYLITNKADVLRMHEIIAFYKSMLKRYKLRFCKEDDIVDL